VLRRTAYANFVENFTGEFQALPSSTLRCRLRLARHGISTPAFYETRGFVTVKPVVVTEWGFQPRAHAHYRGTAKTFGIKFRDRFLQGRGLHSTAWCWSASYGPSLFKRDWRTRTVWGDFAYDYLRAHNRDPARP
jgi:hypothetical protein